VTDAVAALDALHQGIAAARTLELDTAPAEAVAREASERLGIAPDAYVVALVGGTGVGKSTLLNALAGAPVSPAGARRPTTGAPIAWVPSGRSAAVRPLLDRLGIDRPALHDAADLDRLVVLDLPDLDSIEPSHVATVEALLPRLDVVAWVTDPEKYADAVLHDDFLRTWMPRLARQVVVLNKADRLAGDGQAAVARDLRRAVGREVPVLATTATDGPAGIAALRSWLAEAVDAKTVIAARLVAAARAELAALAAAAGVSGDGEVRPLVRADAQRRAIEAATDETLRVVDLPGVERQAVAATRARARRRGTGPVGLVTSAIYRFSGRQRKVADPGEYLRGWRTRGGLARATEAVRRAVVEALPGVPPALRSRYAAAAEGPDLERRLGVALDRVIARRGAAGEEPPMSRLWPIVGLLQSANTVLLIVAAAWIVLWVIARPEVASYDLPVLGPVPAPMVLLGAALIAGYVLARILGWHAGWLGRRWADRLTGALRNAAAEVIEAEAFAPLGPIEDARLELGRAWRRIEAPASPGRRAEGRLSG
jgi:hypothetical protein